LHFFKKIVILEAISKIGFCFKIKAGPQFNPQAYFKYSEELKRRPNTEIGPKDFFEMASSFVKPTIPIAEGGKDI
jgi:hypothetical protein